VSEVDGFRYATAQEWRDRLLLALLAKKAT
jgi:hypothetical protein